MAKAVAQPVWRSMRLFGREPFLGGPRLNVVHKLKLQSLGNEDKKAHPGTADRRNSYVFKQRLGNILGCSSAPLWFLLSTEKVENTVGVGELKRRFKWNRAVLTSASTTGCRGFRSQGNKRHTINKSISISIRVPRGSFAKSNVSLRST